MVTIKVGTIVKEGGLSVLKEGGKVFATGLFYGGMVGLGIEGYQAGNWLVHKTATAVKNAIAKSKAKKEKPVDNNTEVVEPENQVK